MSLKQLGIEHKTIKEMLVAFIRLNIKERKELYTVLDELTRHIPKEHIMGPGFCIFQYVTSVKQGFDVEVGLPVAQAIETDRIKTRIFPKMEVLSLVHTGPVEKLKETYGKLYTSASEHGLISDEFCREVFLDSNNPAGGEIELQFVLHNWNELLGRNLERVLGKEARQEIMQGSDELTLTSTINERFHWVKGGQWRNSISWQIKIRSMIFFQVVPMFFQWVKLKNSNLFMRKQGPKQMIL